MRCVGVQPGQSSTWHNGERYPLVGGTRQRHFAGTNFKPHKLPENAATPTSRVVSRAQQGLQELSPMETYILGHAGDGNMHTMLFFNDSPEQRTLVEGFSDQLVEHAITLGGTCTGEHGVGIGKRKYLQHEYGETAVQTMQLIKRLLDPKGILNPGKVLP